MDTLVAFTQTRASVMMVPDADQVKTSIWPGVSINTYLQRSEVIRQNTESSYTVTTSTHSAVWSHVHMILTGDSAASSL